MLAPKQAKTQVGAGDICELPVLTTGLSYKACKTGRALRGGDSWLQTWQGLWQKVSLAAALRWAAASCLSEGTSCLKQEVVLESGTGSG